MGGDNVRKILLITLILLSTLFFFSFVYATTGTKSILVTFRNIRIIFNGEEKKPSQEPFIFNGSTFVPLRFVSESLGFDVNWDGPTNTVSINYKPNTFMVKRQPVPNAEITVEQFPSSGVIRARTCVTDSNGVFSFILNKDELASLQDQIDLLCTVKVKDTMGYSLEDGASNRLIVRIRKSDRLEYKFTLLWTQDQNQIKLGTNKGAFIINPKMDSG